MFLDVLDNFIFHSEKFQAFSEKFEKNLKLYPSLPTAERVRAGIPGHQAKPDEHDSYGDGQDRCDGQGQITTYVDPGFADEVASSA